MRKILNIGGRDIAFECNAITPQIYHAQFKREFFSDLLELAKSLQGFTDLNDFDGVSYDDLKHFKGSVITDMAWACYATANKMDGNSQKTPEEFLISNPEFSSFTYIEDIADLIISNIQTKKK